MIIASTHTNIIIVSIKIGVVKLSIKEKNMINKCMHAKKEEECP